MQCIIGRSGESKQYAPFNRKPMEMLGIAVAEGKACERRWVITLAMVLNTLQTINILQ